MRPLSSLLLEERTTRLFKITFCFYVLEKEPAWVNISIQVEQLRIDAILIIQKFPRLNWEMLFQDIFRTPKPWPCCPCTLRKHYECVRSLQLHHCVSVHSNIAMVSMYSSSIIVSVNSRGGLSKKNNIFWEFFPTWGGGGRPNPKTFVISPSHFWHAKFILRC